MAKIKIDYTKCTGCRLCEMACSLQHTNDTFQPTKSRIRVFVEENFYYPVIAGSYVETPCRLETVSVMDGRDLDTCILCRASCPVKPIFIDPDTKQPLTCDLCLRCVGVCINGALEVIKDPQNLATIQ